MAIQSISPFYWQRKKNINKGSSGIKKEIKSQIYELLFDEFLNSNCDRFLIFIIVSLPHLGLN